MCSRRCTHGGKTWLVCSSTIPRHGIPVPSPCAPFQQYPTRRSHFAYQWTSHVHTHVTAAAEEQEDDKNQRDTEASCAIPRVQPINPHTTPSRRFITFDQVQLDVGTESRETREREKYSNQIARFLSIQSKNKEDKLFVNKLRNDKGRASHNWRIAFSDLQKNYIPEKIDEPRGNISEQVLSLVQTADCLTQDVDGSNEIQRPARRVIPRSRNSNSFQLARNIVPPTKWSEANLVAFVEALAESQRTQAVVTWAEKPRLKGWTNISDVVAAFDTVFYSKTAQKFLSIKACNIALRFFYDHGRISKARSLYIRMEDLKMDIPTETFNILLRGSASQRDLHNFTFLLHNMTWRGFKPNEKTWALFLQAIDSSTLQAFVVRKMAEMNILDKISVRRDVAAHMVPYEIVNYLDGGHDHHGFLDHMNTKYGIGWLSTSAGNRLLNEVARRKSAVESMSLLYEMKQAGFKPDDISMNTLLRHCLPSKRHELAIEILDAFKYHYNLYPGPAAYETLFLQAWRSRLLNFSRVIWRSACIYSAVSRKIEDRVFRSLLSYTPAPDKPDDTVECSTSSRRNAKFRKFAGRFVIEMDGPGGANLNGTVDTLEVDPRRRTIKWAQALLESSLRVARTCRLKSDLPQLLRQALTMDKTWNLEGLHEKDDWLEKLPNAIAVSVEFESRASVRRIVRLTSKFRKIKIKGPMPRMLRDQNHSKSSQLTASEQISKSIPKIKSVRTRSRLGSLVPRILRGQNHSKLSQLTASQQISKSIRKPKTKGSRIRRTVSKRKKIRRITSVRFKCA